MPCQSYVNYFIISSPTKSVILNPHHFSGNIYFMIPKSGNIYQTVQKSVTKGRAEWKYHLLCSRTLLQIMQPKMICL